MSVKVCLIAAALALAAPAALAADYKAGAIEIKNPWARATPAGAKTGAGYFTLTNTGTTPDRLVGATAAVAGKATIHEMSMSGNVMRMRPVKGVDLKPGQTVEFNPDSFHVMLEKLKGPLKQGETVKGTLTFEKAGAVDIEYAVGSVGGGAPAGTPAAAPSGAMKMPAGSMKMEDTKPPAGGGMKMDNMH